MSASVVNQLGGQTGNLPFTASVQVQPSNPTAPASTGAYKMQGLGASAVITPTRSGKIIVTFSGTVISPAGTAAGNGLGYQISYGTGTAPANAAALTGTQVGTIQSWVNPTTVVAADVFVPFSTTAIITGLTVGTTYWLDLAAESVGTASDMGLSTVSVSAAEFG